MDSASWNQESEWPGCRAGGNFKPRPRACLLALGNLLWPLTWQKYSLSVQLRVRGWGGGAAEG